MKKKYTTPYLEQHSIESEALLISVSTGTDTPPLTPDSGDGDASEALVKPFETTMWDW